MKIFLVFYKAEQYELSDKCIKCSFYQLEWKELNIRVFDTGKDYSKRNRPQVSSKRELSTGEESVQVMMPIQILINTQSNQPNDETGGIKKQLRLFLQLIT